MSTYPQGSIIKCSSCDKPLFTLKKDVEIGTAVSASNLEAIDIQKPAVAGQIAICSYCNQPIRFEKIEIPKN